MIDPRVRPCRTACISPTRGFPAMPARYALFVALLLVLPAPSHAADVTSLRGKFQDPTTMAVVSGVQVKLTNMADTSDVHRLTGLDDGTFEIKGLGVHSYRLAATR